MDIEQPFQLLQVGDSYDVVVRVKGGGLSGQAGAIRLGIARALAKVSEENRKLLRKNGLLTRDSRVVERKKYGMAGARKRYQFSKR
jgi:small subunit ribosomal protein S9